MFERRGTKLIFLVVTIVGLLTGCVDLFEPGGPPKEQGLPSDPVEKAAVLGIFDAYRQTAMYEVKEVKVLSVQPMIPTKDFVKEHDPKELYCACVDYLARYKVPWTTKDASPWTRTVRNILVIQTKGGHFLALKDSGICPSSCL
jgi:hypothetical protein